MRKNPRERPDGAGGLTALIDELDNLRDRLRPFDGAADTKALDSYREELLGRIQSLRQEERRLHIVLLGQVKAGKSSFLNALLFDGEPVLPQALFPATSVLTHLKYCERAERTELAITYYTPEEWRSIERAARSSLETEAARVARELTAAASVYGLTAEDLPPEASEALHFSSHEALAAQLSRYVQEGGERTPLVKTATVRVCHPALRYMTITDTPGLNDPVRSRMAQARKSLQTCDAAFFLSRAGRFLDPGDLRLLLGMMPQKGLARLILVGSLFDAALMDTIYNHPSLEEAIQITRLSLYEHAQKIIDEAENTLEESSPEIRRTLEQCRDPVFVSAEMQTILHQQDRPYSQRQRLILQALGRHGELTQSQMRSISGIGAVQDMLQSLEDRAPTLLSDSAASLLPSARIGLRRLLDVMRSNAFQQAEELVLQHTALLQTQDELARAGQQARSAIHQIYDAFLKRLNKRLEEVQLALCARGQQLAVESRIGVELTYTSKTVSDAIAFLPWTWRRTHREVRAAVNKYEYVDTADFGQLTERLLTDAKIASRELLSLFPGDLYSKLVTAAAEYAADTGYPSKERIEKMAGDAVCLKPPENMALPEDMVPRMERAGWVRDERQQEVIRKAARDAIGLLTAALSEQLSEQAREMRGGLHDSETVFCEQLFQSSARTLRQIEQRKDNLERSIVRLNEAMDLMRQPPLN